MAKRRQSGEGTIAQRPGGTWQARISYIDPVTGQRKRVSVDGPTAAAVRTKMKQARERLEAGGPPRDATHTVAAWLAHWRVTTVMASDPAESTRDTYARLARKHLETAPFGEISLGKLRPSDVEGLVLALRAKGLADATIRLIYNVLRVALDGAVRDRPLARNPAALVAWPGVKRGEARHLDTDVVTAVLRAVEDSRYYPALVLIASTGVRRGEALALSWDRVDLDAGTLTVAATLGRIGKRLVIRQPKTTRSRREIPLFPAMVTMLRRHRIAQKEERLRAGDQWTESGLVFTTALGRPIEPGNMLSRIKKAAAKAGVEDVKVHTLRHSAAVAWLESGVHIKAVSDLLGHSSIAVTGDVYGHTSDTAARAAIDTLGERLGL
jgi:integrase